MFTSSGGRHGSDVPVKVGHKTRHSAKAVPSWVVFVGRLTPFPSPDPFNTLVIYMPAAVVQHPGDHAISVAPELSRQRDDVFGQPFFIRKTEGHLALSGSVLSQCAAGSALGYAKGLPHVVNAPATAGGA